MVTTNLLQRVRENTFLLIALVVTTTFVIAGVMPSRAHATPSNNCWATVVSGASRLYGGCKGNVGGTTFQVVAKCGWMMTEVRSAATYVALNQTKTVPTSDCPWYSQGVRAGTVLSW